MVGRGAVALVLVAAVIVAGCGGKDKKPAEPAKLTGNVSIGVLAPTEHQGEIGVRGRDLQDGARMAIDELNAKGGILGQRVVMEPVDDACDAQVSYEAAKAFITDSDIAGVVGGMCDASAAARGVGARRERAVHGHLGDGRRSRLAPSRRPRS